MPKLWLHRWDSSDPARAPPPLPLNPGSPVLTVRPNTSAVIANAAKALQEKAMENMMPASPYTINPMPQKSPDRSLIKGAQHKRMQSLQNTSVRDLKSFLDGVRSPERSPERPPTRGGTPPRDNEKDYFAGPPSASRVGSSTPPNRDPFKETPALRPSSRSAHKSFLGENTPPSATMLALQTMSVPREHLEPPLPNMSNSSRPAHSGSFDNISTQLLSITSIVSSLQKEMSQLSRRSKDNATDLVSLKEATNSRDEDIRKSLKELVVTMSQVSHTAGTLGDMPHIGSNLGVKDPHITPTKQFTLPRISSPGSFLMDERVGSPNPYSVEGAASVAMLEKIIREMVTKDGQERLIANLQTLVDKATGDTAKKVSELVEFVKQGSAAQPLGSSTAPGSVNFQPSAGTGPLMRAADVNSMFPMRKVAEGEKPYASPKAADFVSEEMLKFLRKIKDSVAESNEVTMETRSILEQFRGQVLGVVQDIALRIEENEQVRADQPALESGQREQPSQDVALIVQDGLTNLKHHMEEVMRERRRQSISSTMSRNTVDTQEVRDVVKHVLEEQGLDQGLLMDKESIVSAIREAYEAYKPNSEIQQFGLDRSEILQCLQEGLQGYQGAAGVTKEDIEQTLQHAIQQIEFPTPINEAHEVREEVIMAVRECLEEFKPSLVPHQPQVDNAMLELILETIREGTAHPDRNMTLEIPPEALTEAIKAALESSNLRTEASDDEVTQRLQSLVDDMHSEFKAYSSANGRDTEQVLDALNDGLDSLRGKIEGYVDKSLDVTHKDEIVDHFRTELEQLRVDVQGYVAEGPRGDHAWSRGDMVGYIKSEFEHLHEELASKFLPSVAQDKEEILNALNEGFEGMKSQVATRAIGPEDNEEINDALKHEFEQMKEVILGDTASHKDVVIEKLQSGFDEVHARITESDSSRSSNEEVLASIKEEFEHLRETLAGTLVRSGGPADKEDIIDGVRELMDGLRSHLASSQEDASKDGIALIQSELEQIKESFGNALVRTDNIADKEELLDAIKAGLNDIKQNSKSMDVNEELLEALRGELEQVRQSDGLTRQHARADAEEVLESVRLGLDDLRSHLEKKLDNPEQQMSARDDIIDAVNEGIEGLRADVTKVVDKPVDMTVSYEILDTLKSGITSIHEEIEKLKGNKTEFYSEEETVPTGNEVVLAEDAEHVANREMIPEPLCRNDLEKMEVILAQLHTKVEGMDANIQTPAATAEPIAVSDSAMKEDLTGIEMMLKELQATVNQLQERETPVTTVEGVAMKEDTDALETLLDNMKAKIEELALPDPTMMVTKENLDDVELVVRTTSENIDALTKKIAEEGATKGDVAVVQVIADDIKQALEEMKAAKPEEEEDMEKVTKADVDVLTDLALEIKAKVEEMKIPIAEELSSKADVEQLTGLIHDFRESHEKLLESYEQDIGVTAKAFDDRRVEAAGLAENMTEVKAALDDIKQEITTGLTEGGALEPLKESINKLEESVGVNLIVSADVKELMESVSREFERAHESIQELQNGQETKSVLALEKQDEAKEAIITGLVEKIDDRFDILMTKYDDAQLLADEQTRVAKEKAAEQEIILESTKAMADELRLTIDTLGASITGMNDRFEEATQKWSSDSATVFDKIDNTVLKLEEQKLEDKTEHSHTRDEIANVERIFTGLQDNITEYHPKFMVTLREIEALVKQHYEHAQKAKEETDEHVRAINEEAKFRAQELSNHFSSLPALLPPPPPSIELPEKYDDTQVQEKLDKLIGHVDDAEKIAAQLQVQEKLDQLIHHKGDTEKSAAQLERLDEIRNQVLATAAEVSEFVTKQTQLIIDGNESKEREAEEVGLLIERRLAQKEHLEADIEGLKADKERVVQELKDEKERVMAELREEKDRTMLEIKEEKDSLLAVVSALQAERENLANQKVRLTGEVSSLHTALEIRREELHMMDSKADALERRILNGIMDHSRALMIAKGGNKSPGKLKKRLSTTPADDSTKLMPPPSIAASGLSMALKPRPAIRRNGPPQNPANRRIHSLSMISGNTPTGAQAFTHTGNTMKGSGNLGRSHSVKTKYLRKGSWGGRPSAVVANKENEPLGEEDETEVEQAAVPTLTEDDRSVIDEEDPDDVQSETGTERRHSLASRSYAGSYADGETPSFDGRSSFGAPGSDYTYGSGSSYMTGSDIDRRTSYGSTAAPSALTGGEGTIDEGSEDEGSEYSGDEDEDHTATVPDPVAPSEIAPSEITASEVTTADDEDAMPTQSEVVRAVEAVRDEMKHDYRGYAAPSDSGVGTDLPTAMLGNESEADYFRRAAEEESNVG
jgi:DNA repair exonuclease SbcCD ATPase subunit